MSELLFIVLNMADAVITKVGLEFGATEANPVMAVVGSVPIIKGLIALGVIMGNRRWGGGWSIWIGNFLVFGALVWNIFIVMILSIGGVG